MTGKVLVNADFIADALYTRFYNVNDRRGGEIYSRKIHEFVDLCCECGVDGTASTIIDNWLINGGRWTYVEFIEQYKDELASFPGQEEFDLEDEEFLEQVEDLMLDHGLYFDRELKEAISF